MELANILPQIVLLTTAVLILIQRIFVGDSRHNLNFGILGGFLALLCSFWMIHGTDYHGLFTDYPARLSLVLTIIVLIITLLLSLGRDNLVGRYSEWTFLLITATLGLSAQAGSHHLLVVFLGFQVSILSLFFLCLFKDSTEPKAAVKYLTAGLLFSLFFLLGSALIFIEVGSLEIDSFLLGDTEPTAIFWTGYFLVVFSLFFKLALVPLHSWAVDVYKNTQTPLTAYMTTAEKIPVFVILMRFLILIPSPPAVPFDALLVILALLTLIFASLVAFVQTDVKSMLCWGSIAQCGIPLLGLLVVTPESFTAVWFFLVVFILSNMIVFGFVMMSAEDSAGRAYYTDIKGLWHQEPYVTVALAIGVLSLIGIPPSGGFFSRILLFREMLRVDYFWVVVVALLAGIASAVYYLKIIRYSCFEQPAENFKSAQEIHPVAKLTLYFAAGMVFIVGVFPGVLLSPLTILSDFF